MNRERIFLLAGIGLTTLAIGLLLGLWLAGPEPQPPSGGQPNATVTPTERTDAAEETMSEETAPALVNEPEPAAVDKAALEQIIAGFKVPDGGRLSVVVYDLTSREYLLAHNKEYLYPTASLYKLYLAYMAYEDVDSGRLSLAQPFIKHLIYKYELNLGVCLNLMITVSDSPCGETLLAHYDYPVIQARLKELGLPHANAGAFRASAEDMTRLLELIYGDNLSANSRDRLLGSMSNQAYDVILQPAFRDRARVYNKTGAWRDGSGEGYYWIDVGIIELADRDQAFAVSILHENVPTKDLLALAEELADAVL